MADDSFIISECIPKFSTRYVFDKILFHHFIEFVFFYAITNEVKSYICRAEVTLFAEVITSTFILAEVITSSLYLVEVKLRQTNFVEVTV
ncbi:hypothetical protein I4U23_016504 [Adineta vaga]|nr:hypothetical protein I4U23_016504 [Adineta vaga]